MTIFRKMNRTGLILSLFAATICSAVIVSAAIKEPKDAKCPVSGEACDPEANATFAGGKIWFCCDKCAAAFKADSAKFAAKSHQQMVSTGQLKQKGCPFSGKPVNAATVIDIGGAEVGFCCPVCKGKAEKDKGDEQIDLVFGDISKGFAPAGK